MVLSREYFVGLDLGQKRDHTAIAVLERAQVRTGDVDRVTWRTVERTECALRHVERVALGTSYPRIVEGVGALLEPLAAQGRCTLVVDETGVGGPVVDLLRGAGLKCELVPVTITGGDAARRANGGRWLVPKRDLVTGLQVMFERGELRIARGLREVGVLVEEMRNMRVRVSATGQESFAAWREGAHDDLVLAVALACWRGWVRKRQPIWGRARLV